MSNVSGKCDLKDFFDGCDDEYIKNSQIFYGRLPVPLRIENRHDLSPFYPFLVASAQRDKNGCSLRISERSYVDYEEEDFLTWTLNALKRIWRRCKRKKLPYNPEEALHKIKPLMPDDGKELAKRVEMYKEKATIEGIHDEMHEYYRNKLLDEMVALGWDKKKARYWIWNDWRVLLATEEDDGKETKTEHEAQP